MFISRSLSYFLIFFSLSVTAQKLKKADKVTVTNLQSHITYLASDQLEGRRAGTNGEKLAMEYISTQFQKNGLLPKGDNATFYQEFSIWEGKRFDEKSFLFINDDTISVKDFFPLPASPETSLESMPSIALKETGVPWFLDIREDLLAQQNNPHFDLMPYVAEKARNAFQKGATGLFIYNSGSAGREPVYDPKQRMDSLPIPVVIVKSDIAKKYFRDETAVLNIRLTIHFDEIIRTAHNVIGFIDNHAATTAVLGAHYDHLGFGEDGNSLMSPGERLIHHGADDNASGIAALIELSRLLKNSGAKNNNYLFIAFSGEELGLFGSKYFVAHPTVELATTNYMINMDMVGRLDENTKSLIIGGYGTSPQWAAILKKPAARNVVPSYDSSGAGPSDHTSFYEKRIPVLFFFTGIHGDYHKPTDEPNKINYAGEFLVLQYIFRVIEAANKNGKLEFTPTRDHYAQTTSSFAVTLGIRPDYSFNGSGVRVDAVSTGRPAEQAGLKTGDVVVQLGEFPISSLENYMQALNKFKKGDKTKVKVKRATDTIESEITF